MGHKASRERLKILKAETVECVIKEHNSTIKSIVDVLGHRYIDTTFIYAKADLNSLREVAMPWPGKE